MDRQPLTRDQLRQFRQDGFLRLEDFAPPDEVAALSPIYDRLFRTRAGWEEGNYFDFARPEAAGQEFVVPQLLQLSRYAPELLSMSIVGRGRALARQILGPMARLDLDHGVYKAAGASGSTPWHQDEAFWDGRYDHDGFSIWIPLQPVDAQSGCLHFVPGSHRHGVLRHRPIGGDPRVRGLEVADFVPVVSRVCPLPLGGATLHHARTLHYSEANTSSVGRRAYILTFSGRRRRRLIARTQHGEASQSAATLRARAHAEKA